MPNAHATNTILQETFSFKHQAVSFLLLRGFIEDGNNWYCPVLGLSVCIIKNGDGVQITEAVNG